MSRSRDAVDRRAFVKEAALVAAAATGLSGGLGALNELLGQPGAGRTVSRSILRSGGPRPFNMICLGDSVMWGQGLQESSKFATQVRTWLERQLPGRTVNSFMYARSGATITRDPKFDESRIQPWMNDRALGEVPCSWPYVERQVGVARDDLTSLGITADSVDLVLLDGGANDVGITTILNPLGLMDLPSLRNSAAQLCGRPMTRLLPQVQAAFPKAKILVTGYYPIVSDQSDLTAIGLLLALLFTPGGFLATIPLRGRLTQQSNTWYDASNENLSAAVAALNRTVSPDPMYNTPVATFARIPWAPRNAYAAPETRLWLVGLPNDEVYFERRAACQTGGKLADALCLDAKMGHPNPAGARAYASACTAHLNPYLNEWRGARLMSACVEMDPMPAVGTATTLTVHATQIGTNGRMTVPGTVRVGTATFPTDTAVPLTLCTRRTTSVGGAAASTGREREERERATVTTCAPMTVSAPGYVDVVITNYLAATLVP